jgi:hypothetical protein
LPIPISSKIFPTLSCTNFRVWSLILRSLIHVELILGNIHFLQEHLVLLAPLPLLCHLVLPKSRPYSPVSCDDGKFAEQSLLLACCLCCAGDTDGLKAGPNDSLCIFWHSLCNFHYLHFILEHFSNVKYYQNIENSSGNLEFFITPCAI